MRAVESTPPTAAKKRPVSERKLQANRANALQSTGPKTPRGKRTSSQNSIKHGLLTREVVNTEQERQADFDALLTRIRDQDRPVGQTEELLVERTATLWWRLARYPELRMAHCRGN